jgi:hypothetical protein
LSPRNTTHFHQTKVNLPGFQNPLTNTRRLIISPIARLSNLQAVASQLLSLNFTIETLLRQYFQKIYTVALQM